MMTNPALASLRFYLTAPSACPYLADRKERKVFTHLPSEDGAEINNILSSAGFRRSQGIAYRPACETCSACASVRIPVRDYVFSRSEKRTLRRNDDLVRQAVPSIATAEQYRLLKRYLEYRHPSGGMADMTWPDYCAMVEESAVRTYLVEYRARTEGENPGKLVACVLVDALQDGLSLVYSFYEPQHTTSSLGSYVILDHVRWARNLSLPYVYLGYWVPGSAKMAYKARFEPLEVLRSSGWILMSARDRSLPAPGAAPASISVSTQIMGTPLPRK